MEDAMVLNDLVVVVSEDALVVVDETKEAAGNVTEVVLADCQTRGDLKDNTICVGKNDIKDDIPACSSWCRR